ncbi:DUF7504 family protein [Haloarchaeobius iranensis]|uniref:RecA-superfamily ATPase, KaiC/GvpD/RAD55 family n=1 Tax=Haloarchaeobius iranensis TaxID=996166 RepID=A0A1H0BF65_9EURY|nr:hypothetical protein [Haloarchaeobius iranensis]SDN44240.1 hypothetical protein SAMN05192554_1393 [Haloarchaeobius iranensis]
MDGNANSTVEIEALLVDPLPESLSGGSTVLVATTGDPSQHAVCLRILCAQGTEEDTAFVVTTRESANRTIAVYNCLGGETGQPSISIVDTVSEQQSISALYGETHVVFTPSPGDLERLVMALSDLSDSSVPSNRAHHLLIRSLTPVLKATSATHVGTVLERITGLRSESGLCLLGIDYTAHDEETMAAIAPLVDGVLWVTQPSPDRLAFDYQPTRGRHSRSVLDDGTDD